MRAPPGGIDPLGAQYVHTSAVCRFSQTCAARFNMTDLCKQHRGCVNAGPAVAPRTDIYCVGDWAPRAPRPSAHEPGQAIDITARIERRQTLGGLISEYRRASLASAKHQFRGGERVLARHRPDVRPGPGVFETASPAGPYDVIARAQVRDTGEVAELVTPGSRRSMG